MSCDTPESRDELSTAWRAVSQRLVQCGFARSAVVETMIDSALHDLDELYGTFESTHRLLVLAKQRHLQANGKAANGSDRPRFERRSAGEPARQARTAETGESGENVTRIEPILVPDDHRATADDLVPAS